VDGSGREEGRRERWVERRSLTTSSKRRGCESVRIERRVKRRQESGVRRAAGEALKRGWRPRRPNRAPRVGPTWRRRIAKVATRASGVGLGQASPSNN
jgi:hypothetical protein